MSVPWRRAPFSRGRRRRWPLLLTLILLLLIVRLSKGALLNDAYALLSLPFWPGPAQSEWLRSARSVEDQARLQALASDNDRLRQLLALQRSNADKAVSAPVISRQSGGWWQQLVIGKGALAGVRAGQPVVGPGGLIGLVASVTPATATITLLTDPSSRVGVWVNRSRNQGLLSGSGSARPLLRFLDKDPEARPGDLVVTSPASTLVPPNLPVGVIQAVDANADPAPVAVVQLIAPVQAIDWVQVLRP
ncbi:MAG: rod shape-determining protein MreC [Cyanobacteria bacterium K_Offshore_surface_m2_239]|nr:rod shape-determining protein MreC [Cyanobacteria bacterium K_Offshore_surface_m2_239]